MNRPADLPRTRELIVLCRQLGAMLNAGTEIRRALLIVRDQMSQPELQNALETAHNDMELGWTLAHSLGRNPTLFSPFFIDMIRQGEGEGTLGSVLEDLASYLEKQLRMETEMPAAVPAVYSAGGLPTLQARRPESLYRLAVWIGAGLGCSSAGWAYAAAGGSGYAGFAGTVLALGLALAGWAASELRLARTLAQPSTEDTLRPEAAESPPLNGPSRRPSSPHEAFGVNPPNALLLNKEAQALTPKPADQPASSKPAVDDGRNRSGPPSPPIPGDRRSMPL